MIAVQRSLTREYPAPPKQLLKWVGNKHRFAPTIVSVIPPYHRYIEPFVGTGAVLGTLAPNDGLAGDALAPLIGIWKLVQKDPEALIDHYAKTRKDFMVDPDGTYERVKVSFNREANPLDLLFISRSCYGGVVRFTVQGTISTPRGPHTPIPAKSFAERVYEWRERVKNTRFVTADYKQTMSEADEDDVVYCDPPYIYSQSILYGSQGFDLHDLWNAIECCVKRGAKVLLSIDGKRRSGKELLEIDAPNGLFKREMWMDVGPSMLLRFQKGGENMEGEDVHDRLLLTW